MVFTMNLLESSFLGRLTRYSWEWLRQLDKSALPNQQSQDTKKPNLEKTNDRS